MVAGTLHRVVVAASIAVAGCRSRDPDPPAALPPANPALAQPPRATPPPPPPTELDQKVLADHVTDAHELVVADGYVYFADGQRHLRVPTGSGEVEDAPIWPNDQKHGRLGDDAMAYDSGVFFQIRGDGIYREPEKPRHAPWTQLARSFPSDDHKAFVLDGDRIYWIEPAASAVLSVAKTGGPVSFVCEAKIPVYDDLAVHGDTLYLIDISGGLDFVDKQGGPMRSAGLLRLGYNKNGVWMSAGDDALYVVSNAIGSFRSAEGEGSVSRVAYPSGGDLVDLYNDGLIFPATAPELQETHREFAAISDDVRAGRVTVTIKVIAATDEQGRAEAAPLEAQLKSDLGPDARIEVVIVRPPPGTTRRLPWSSVGITPEHAMPLFAPPR